MSYGRIPEEVIEAVLNYHDIADVVGKYVNLTKQGQYLKGLCPFHSEKTPSFTVTPERQTYYCFGCHAGGNSIHFLMEKEGYSFIEAVRHMAEEANIPITWESSSGEETERQKEASALLAAHELAAKWYHYVLLNTEQGRHALEYLRSRGLGDKWIDFFQIGYAPPMRDKLGQFLMKRELPQPMLERAGLIAARSDGSGYIDRFRDRIIFPIHDYKGRVIAFAGRALGDFQPKYLNSPETPLFNKSRQLFNLHHARPTIRKSGQAVLFEGYMDVIKAWEAGVLNGVATMGTALTEEHALALRRVADTAIVCYDGDQAGQAAAYKSIPVLEKAGLHVKIAVIPDESDPDEYISAKGADKFRSEVVEAAMPAVQFRLAHIRTNFNLNDVDDKFRYLTTAARIIAELPSAIEREHYVKELSTEFSYSADAIKQEMNEFRQQFLKKREIGDNNENPWNNGIDNNRGMKKAPSLLPAFHIAEIKLLAAMMLDRDIAEEVSQRIGDQFNIEDHAALAAYLYAFYNQGNRPEISRFLAFLQDEGLSRLASSIAVRESGQGINPQVIEDYIREIKKVPYLNAIKQKKQEMVQAERSGSIVQAAQIASEIITLEKQLKSL
ncbi:DNA primase [Paenibacillus sp. J2TS4]|uniref:DNA primase n=1 Tax=Paenibacillus sp. J2TS4 TaxID=2807194 RepID=UPI001B1A2248|nr:DNA primase [Paenibacillus sp. J2TS4]GIP35820.1 DNA primase [Paenibacillus sp. J2TS4]